MSSQEKLNIIERSDSMLKCEINKEDTMALKGVAILSVMLCHLPRIIDFPEIVAKMTHPIGIYFGINMFLALSGYGLAVSSNLRGGGRHGFWKRRLQKILPTLSLSIWLVVLVKGCMGQWKWSFLEIVLNSIGVSCTIGRVTWYITFQYVCYFLFFALGIERSKKPILLYMLSSLIILIFTIKFDINSLGTGMWGLSAFSFQIGVIWGIYQDEINQLILHWDTKKRMIVLLLLGMLFIGLFVFCYFILNNPTASYIQNPIKSLIAAVACVAALYLLALKSFYHIKQEQIEICLKKLGSISFELFLAHGLIIFQFPELFEGTWLPVLIKFMLLTIVTTIALKVVTEKIVHIVS